MQHTRKLSGGSLVSMEIATNGSYRVRLKNDTEPATIFTITGDGLEALQELRQLTDDAKAGA